MKVLQKICVGVLVLVPACVLTGSCSGEHADSCAVPCPNVHELRAETVDFSKIKWLACPEKLENTAMLFKEELKTLGFDTQIADASRYAVSCKIDGSLGEEEYELTVSRRGVKIRAGSAAGFFYATRTILQELRAGGLHLGKISDSPRYKWRGFMLDEARHFMGKEKVEAFLDVMAYFKLNRFHWHLTDAQGWRIEIKSYPKLAAVGGIGCHSNPDAEAAYYTQDEIREIVQYAADRFIEIIPEIDMPGHASAANRAYPEFNGGGEYQFSDYTFNVGKDGTYQYLTDILREVRDLFPSGYLHIGGDEVAVGNDDWAKDKYVQSLIEREGLDGIAGAEKYFVRRMADSVKVLDRELVAWQDVRNFGLDTVNNVIVWWRHDDPNSLTEILDDGYRVILCPRRPLYFDFIQHEIHKVGRTWGGFCPIEDIYTFPDSLFRSLNLTEEKTSKVIGMQAAMWTELIHNKDRFDFMVFPRLCAVAESAWSNPSVKDYVGFTERMEYIYPYLDRLGIRYFDPRQPLRVTEPLGPVVIKRK